MPRNVDSTWQTFKVAGMLCIVCSVIVSGVAVALRGQQQANRLLFVKTNILQAGDLWYPRMTPDEIRATFEQRVIERLVDLRTGEPLAEKDYTDEVRPGVYDQRQAVRDPALRTALGRAEDVASIRFREHYAYVYLIRGEDGRAEQLILPIRGYGLWSTLYGFLSINVPGLVDSPDVAEVRGLTYYEHAETPGLGGEVDNPSWKAQWDGKRIFDQEWNVQLRVIRGTVDPAHAQSDYQVDGLAGATITANGVTNMLRFWLGDNGFGPFLRNVHENPEILERMLEGQTD